MITCRRRACWVWIGTCAFFSAEMAEAQVGVPGQSVSDSVAVEANPLDVGGGETESERSVLAAAPASDAAPADVAGRNDLCRCIGESDGAAVARIEAKLRGPLGSNGLDFTDIPLVEVVNLLQEEYGIPIQLDVPALDAIGLDKETPVTIAVNNISLRSALRLALKSINLTFVIEDEVLKITTPEAAEARLATCVYDVRDIVRKASAAQGPHDFDSLIDTITSCIRVETWKENGGGESNIRPLHPGLLVISQTHAVHEEIRALLGTVQEMGSVPPAEDHSGADDSSDAGQTVTKSYVLQVSQEANVEKLSNQVRDLIVRALPDEQWDGRSSAGDPIVLSMLADRVVLRHTPDVHERVQALLVDSGIATPALGTDESRNRGGGFGGGGGGGVFSPRTPAND